MIRIILCLFLSLTTLSYLGAQCGSVVEAERYRQAKNKFGPWLEYAQNNRSNRAQANSLQRIPMKVTIFTSGSASPCSIDEFMTALEACNNAFASEDIEFYVCQDIRVINNPTYYNINLGTEESSLASTYDQGRVMNLYICNNLIAADGDGLNGKAAFPWRSHTRVYLRGSVIRDSNNRYKTMAHEFGHFMGLLHTHSTTSGREDATRITSNSCYNCATAGDELCDTPADPNVDGNYNSSCNYTGGGSSTCSGLSYAPDVRNLMSYGRDCRTRFSAGQFTRMRDLFNFYYTDASPNGKDLTCDCAPVEINVGHDLKASHIYAAPTIKMSKNIESNANVVFVGQKILLQVGFNATGTGTYSAESGCSYPFLYEPEVALSPAEVAWLEEESPVSSLATEEDEKTVLPEGDTQIFPNPAREEVHLNFYLKNQEQLVEVSVWNLQGQLVARPLPLTRLTTGWQELSWNLVGYHNEKVPPGTYWVSIQKGDDLETKRMVVQ